MKRSQHLSGSGVRSRSSAMRDWVKVEWGFEGAKAAEEGWSVPTEEGRVLIKSGKEREEDQVEEFKED